MVCRKSVVTAPDETAAARMGTPLTFQTYGALSDPARASATSDTKDTGLP
jgi:hypothetical protein